VFHPVEQGYFEIVRIARSSVFAKRGDILQPNI
jgi:hypothetical protein